MAQRTQPCARCGDAFTTQHGRKKYCSRKCASDAMNAKHNQRVEVRPRACAHCNIDYTPKRSDSKFCSARCNQRHHYAPKDNTRKCAWCHTSFKPKRSDARFCSTTCRVDSLQPDRPRSQRRCCECLTSIAHRMGNAKYCEPCAKAKAKQAAQAPRFVRCARCDAAVTNPCSRYCSATCRAVGARARRAASVKTCRGCCTEFVSRSNRGKFCSNKCGQVFRNHGVSPKRSGRTCVTCGVSLPLDANLATKYCGEECRPCGRPHGRPSTQPRKFRRRTIACAYCLSDFETSQSRQKYCSERCGSRALSSRYTHEEYERRFGNPCQRCGEQIPIPGRVDRKFCCQSCQVCFNQEMRRARKRGLPTEKISRADVFKRDGYTCHICLNPVTDKPVLDHLIPLAHKDSPGHVWENVACCHAFCNHSKGPRVRPQDYDLYIRLSLGGSVVA